MSKRILSEYYNTFLTTYRYIEFFIFFPLKRWYFFAPYALTSSAIAALLRQVCIGIVFFCIQQKVRVQVRVIFCGLQQ